MNANLIFVLGLVMMAIALFVFIITVLIPAKCEKDVLFSGWIVTDEDGESYVCMERPWRQNWSDSKGEEHGMWWNDDGSFLAIRDVFSREEQAQIKGLPTWDDEPVRVELVRCRDIDDVPMSPEMTDDGMCDVV